MPLKLKEGEVEYDVESGWSKFLELRPDIFRATLYATKELFPEGRFTPYAAESASARANLPPQLSSVLAILRPCSTHTHEFYRYVIIHSGVNIPTTASILSTQFIADDVVTPTLLIDNGHRSSTTPPSASLSPDFDQAIPSTPNPVTTYRAGALTSGLPDPRPAANAILDCVALKTPIELTRRWTPTLRTLEQQGATLDRKRIRVQLQEEALQPGEEDRIMSIIHGVFNRVEVMFRNSRNTAGKGPRDAHMATFNHTVSLLDAANDPHAAACAQNLRDANGRLHQQTSRGQFRRSMFDLVLVLNSLIFGGIDSLCASLAFLVLALTPGHSMPRYGEGSETGAPKGKEYAGVDSDADDEDHLPPGTVPHKTTRTARTNEANHRVFAVACLVVSWNIVFGLDGQKASSCKLRMPVCRKV